MGQTLSVRFHGEMENGYFTGYELLHGSKGIADRGPWKGEDQGDVQMRGTATVVNDSNGTRTITYDLTFTWNDIVDPNPTYGGDTFMSSLLHAVGNPRDYKVKISWGAKPVVNVCPTKQLGQPSSVSGTHWPYDHQ